MEDAASETSDWEVLSAPGGDGDGDGGVLVYGEGGDVLRDHFALVAPVPGDGEGLLPGAVSDEGMEEARLGSKGWVDWVSGVGSDPAAGDSISTAEWQVEVGSVVEETAESSAPDAAAAGGGATWSAEAARSETLEEESMGDGCGESFSVLQPPHHAAPAAVESLGSDPATLADGLQSGALENSGVQLGDGGVDSAGRSSAPEAIPAGGGMQSAPSGCSESDGAVEEDGSLPLVQTPGAGEGESQVVVWWRLPFRLLHYCAWKVKPVWSISIAAALLGIVVLGRRMYKMRRKLRGLPKIKMAFDEKRASQLADRTARLNEAFLIARRVPFIRTSSAAVLPWSFVQER